MQNVECKYELRDFALARTIALATGCTFIASLKQKDTYYRLTTGRLKRRECIGESPEYIFYDRSDDSRPRLSNFMIYTESEAQTRFGSHPLSVWITVTKTRELFMFENVRIHLDTVENLGTFLEFEALVSPSHHMSQCHATLAALKSKFAPTLGEPLSTSYSDLLAQKLAISTLQPAGQFDLPEIEPPKAT
jgi:adenylate cyclase class IV